MILCNTNYHQPLLNRVGDCTPNPRCHTISKTTKSHFLYSWIEEINRHAYVENINRVGIAAWLHPSWSPSGAHSSLWQIAVDHHQEHTHLCDKLQLTIICQFHVVHHLRFPAPVECTCTCRRHLQTEWKKKPNVRSLKHPTKSATPLSNWRRSSQLHRTAAGEENPKPDN
jgi:hypothetical protein